MERASRKRFFDCAFDDCAVDFDDEIVEEVVHNVGPYPTPAHHWSIDFGQQSPLGEIEDTEDPYPTGDTVNAKEYYDTYVARTPEQCAIEAAAPQRSVAWKNARKFAITASDFGAALGTNAYCTPTELVKKKVWGTFTGNAATKWGSIQEAHAEEAFLEWARETISPDATLHTVNLTKYSLLPWIAVSPDGILTYTKHGVLRADLVEYKCPIKTQSDAHPYKTHPNCTPPYYRDQMMGMLHYINACGGITIGDAVHKLESAWFVVWQPRALWVVPHVVREDEWTDRIYPGLRTFYFCSLLPALVWLHNGKIKDGETEPFSEIDV